MIWRIEKLCRNSTYCSLFLHSTDTFEGRRMQSSRGSFCWVPSSRTAAPQMLPGLLTQLDLCNTERFVRLLQRRFSRSPMLVTVTWTLGKSDELCFIWPYYFRYGCTQIFPQNMLAKMEMGWQYCLMVLDRTIHHFVGHSCYFHFGKPRFASATCQNLSTKKVPASSCQKVDAQCKMHMIIKSLELYRMSVPDSEPTFTFFGPMSFPSRLKLGCNSLCKTLVANMLHTKKYRHQPHHIHWPHIFFTRTTMVHYNDHHHRQCLVTSSQSETRFQLYV